MVKLETLLTLGVVGAVLYMVYLLAQQFGVNPQSISAAVTSTVNTIENASTGTLSNSQTSELITSETNQLILAGVPPSQAQAQATSDVNASLNVAQPTYWDGVKAAFASL